MKKERSQRFQIFDQLSMMNKGSGAVEPVLKENDHSKRAKQLAKI
jgi:hypothetical protein